MAGMSIRKAGVAAGVVAMALAAPLAEAGTSGAVYDMSPLLRQGHPFANPYIAQPAAPTPAAPVETAQATRAAPPPPPPPPAALAKHAEKEGLGGILSEVRAGALLHDFGPFSHRKESGYDANLELLFVSPDILDLIWSPRPHIGGSFNSDGDTNQGYFGLTWEWEFLENRMGAWFAGFSFGGAVHDGHLDDDEPESKQLGCHLLFRESVTGGFRFAEHHGVMLHFDHISNAKICSTNEGLEGFGVRYGYKF